MADAVRILLAGQARCGNTVPVVLLRRGILLASSSVPHAAEWGGEEFVRPADDPPPSSSGSPAPAASNAKRDGPARQRNTVLVIDDESSIRGVLREVLEDSGYNVLTAADGAAGIATFHSAHDTIGLVILDMVMPGLGGRETFERLHRIAPRVPVLVCTGFSETADLDFMRQHGIAGILQKPVSIAVLRKIVFSLMSDPGSQA